MSFFTRPPRSSTQILTALAPWAATSRTRCRPSSAVVIGNEVLAIEAKPGPPSGAAIPRPAVSSRAAFGGRSSRTANDSGPTSVPALNTAPTP